MVQYLADIYAAVSSAIKGMGITIKHIYRKPVTLQYPDERWVLPERFKGFVYLDNTRCNACMQCAKACPVSCIYIETEGKGKDRQMTRYAIDYNKCIWCSFCTDPCPHDAITMSHDYDHSLYFRDKLVYEFIPPDKPVPCHADKRREAGLFVDEKPKAKPAPKPRPKPEAAASEEKPAETAAETAAEKPAETAPAPEPVAAKDNPGPVEEPAAPAASDDAPAEPTDATDGEDGGKDQ